MRKCVFARVGARSGRRQRVQGEGQVRRMPTHGCSWVLICSEACTSLIATDTVSREEKDLEDARVIGEPAETQAAGDGSPSLCTMVLAEGCV